MNSRPGKMYESKPLRWACLAVVLALTACGQQAPPDTRAADASAIKDLDAQWSKKAAANDLDGTMSFYADDASLLPANAPIAIGTQAIRAVWAAFLVPGTSVSWEASKVEVARSGDLAYSTGVYQETTKDPQGKTVMDHGKYVEVWQKQADGKWKVVVDTYNSDLPVAPPEKKAAKPRRHARAASHHKRRRS
jgi:uncharacterized protein (TIGR02246 family)